MVRTNVPQTMVIAEMAWSHNGSLDTALEILHGTKAAGADAVGIHITSLADYMVPGYVCRAGQTLSGSQLSDAGDIYRYLSRINLSNEQWALFCGSASALGIRVCAMCNDEPSLDFAMTQPAIDVYAVAAACFTDLPFVRRVAATGRPLVLRIGGATLGEISDVLETARDAGNHDITCLHGIQSYPTDIDRLNLSVLPTLRDLFQCSVGLADHIDGALPAARYLPLLAIALGAVVIEKHITVDRTLKHEDFEAALGITDFTAFVQGIREAERAIGNGQMALTDDDKRYRMVSRKKIVTARALAAGSPITWSDMAFKRSDTGLDPAMAHLLVGRAVRRDVASNEGLDWDVLC